jgi:hypothetical protein
MENAAIRFKQSSGFHGSSLNPAIGAFGDVSIDSAGERLKDLLRVGRVACVLGVHVAGIAQETRVYVALQSAWSEDLG